MRSHSQQSSTSTDHSVGRAWSLSSIAVQPSNCKLTSMPLATSANRSSRATRACLASTYCACHLTDSTQSYGHDIQVFMFECCGSGLNCDCLLSCLKACYWKWCFGSLGTSRPHACALSTLEGLSHSFLVRCVACMLFCWLMLMSGGQVQDQWTMQCTP